MLWSNRQPSLTLAAKVKGLAREEQAHDEAKEAQDGAENFDDQDLDESVIVAVSVKIHLVSKPPQGLDRMHTV